MTETPDAENAWAFIDEFRFKNEMLYNDTFDAGLTALWCEVADIYRRLGQYKRLHWLPADLYFSFHAHRSTWSFALHMRTKEIENTSFYCLRDRLAPATDHIAMQPVSLECYLSNIALEDRYPLAGIFPGKKYKVTGNYMSIEL